MTFKENSDVVRTLVYTAEDLDLRPRLDYSGRGMYGKDCFGVVGNFNVVGMFVAKATQRLLEDEEKNVSWLFDDMKMDNGRNGSIVYWPHIQIIK